MSRIIVIAIIIIKYDVFCIKYGVKTEILKKLDLGSISQGGLTHLCVRLTREAVLHEYQNLVPRKEVEIHTGKKVDKSCLFVYTSCSF